MKRFATALVMLGALIGSAAFAYQSPGAPTGYVNDFAGMLSQQEKTTLESTLTDFHSQYGGEVVVVTVNDLGGDAIENYANALFRQWGIGSKDKNNGVLLIISKSDRKLRIEVGYGYEGELTDARSSEIIRNTITPYFKQGAYGLGILSGVHDILVVLGMPGTITESAAPMRGNAPEKMGNIALLGFIFLPWIASIFARSKSWWLGGVVGGLLGGVVMLAVGFVAVSFIATGLLVLLGLLLDFFVSRSYTQSVGYNSRPPWWSGGTWGGGGGGGFSSGGGGFGGFGGGSSGGGGASGSW